MLPEDNGHGRERRQVRECDRDLRRHGRWEACYHLGENDSSGRSSAVYSLLLCEYHSSLTLGFPVEASAETIDYFRHTFSFHGVLLF